MAKELFKLRRKQFAVVIIKRQQPRFQSQFFCVCQDFINPAACFYGAGNGQMAIFFQ
ncbi:hypothetical protein HUSEC41_13076 [Escherichia coli O104:H4 str. 01-09591]|nr:hypothetical protein HUSEC41_13076 [Escherichia coli O104:H4 str. 01-09591]